MTLHFLAVCLAVIALLRALMAGVILRHLRKGARLNSSGEVTALHPNAVLSVALVMLLWIAIPIVLLVPGVSIWIEVGLGLLLTVVFVLALFRVRKKNWYAYLVALIGPLIFAGSLT
jgi:hypothetical protein